MKKIIKNVLSIAACAIVLVSCNKSDYNGAKFDSLEVPFEVQISSMQTKLYDASLTWQWNSSDVIYAYQVAGVNTVNELSNKGDGKFGNSNFKLATTEPASFHFIYEGEAVLTTLDEKTRWITLFNNQSGKWNPTFVGTALNTTISSTSTVVEMKPLTSALEIRLWNPGVNKTDPSSADKKAIKNISISSNKHNLLLELTPVYNPDGTVSYTQKPLEDGTTSEVYVFDANSSEVVFNIAPSTTEIAAGDITVSITDENSEMKTFDVPAFTYEVGKRSIFNVEWSNATPAENVAKGKNVQADCELSPNSTFHITDGSLANLWQCDKSHENHWCIVDLGALTPINNIVVSWDGNAYAKNIQINVSTDGINYDEVYSVSNWAPTPIPREEGSAWLKVVTDAKFTQKEVRYIKVDFNGDSSLWGIAIYELEAYNK